MFKEVLRKFFGTLQNTYNFFALYANLDGFTGGEKNIDYSKRTFEDQWIISKLNSTIKLIDSYLETYNPTKAARCLNQFLIDDLSNWYVRLNRKRFWKGDFTEDKKKAYQTLFECLEKIAILSSPFIPFYSEHLFRDLNALSKNNDFEGTVKFIFQGAEEGPPPGEEGGARMMIKEGVLENPNVDAIFGLHIAAQLPMNKVYYKPKGFYASSSRFTIKVIGTQAHGGTPWLSVDPIVITAQIINSIQTIISRESELTKEPAVISFGKVEGGNRFNIIPGEVNLVGTIRSLDYGMRDYIKKRIVELSQGIARSYGGNAIIEIDDGADITFNDPAMMNKMLPSLKKSAGSENVILSNAKTLAEDYAYYLNEIPGFLFELGGYNTNEKREAPAHHTPDFFIDDSSLLLGVKVMTNLALDFLDSE